MKKKWSAYRRLWIGIGILILLAPIGLILPELFKAGGVWGEWRAEELKGKIGYVPEGLKKLSRLWSAPLSDYAFSGWGKGIKSYVAYILSGILGVSIVAAVSYILGKVLRKRQK